MDVVFKRKFRIATYDVDPYGDVRPSSLMNYLQETSGLHSDQWKFSVSDMLKLGKTWVISRYHIQFLRRPRVHDEVEVATWTSGRFEKFATRDFEVTTARGEVVARAVTSYALISLKERKPIALTDDLPVIAVHDRRLIDDPFPTIPQLGIYEREVTLPVMLRDLDINEHVNHVVYAQWGLEGVPMEIWKDYRPASIEISYRAETRYGDAVRSRAQRQEGDRANADGPQYIHQILSRELGVEVARLRTTWVKHGRG